MMQRDSSEGFVLRIRLKSFPTDSSDEPLKRIPSELKGGSLEFKEIALEINFSEPKIASALNKIRQKP